MARPGYVEARWARDKAEMLFKGAQENLAEVEANPLGRTGYLLEVCRNDALKGLERAKADFEAAEKAFQEGFARPASSGPREYFSATLSLGHLSVTKETYEAAMARCQSDGIKAVELVRRALSAYLGLQTPENSQDKSQNNS